MQHQTIEYFDGPQRLLSELIYDKDKYSAGELPTILVFHALEGRNDFALKYAENFAKQGYAAVAVI